MSSSTCRTALLVSGVFVSLCLTFAAGFGYQLWNDDPDSPETSEPLAVFWEAWDRIEEHFYGALPSARERTYGAIREALLMLNDPYTTFVEPQPRELERDRMRGVYGGIGVAVWRDSGSRMVLSPYADSPAQRSGVWEGDILLAVDSKVVTDKTTVDEVRGWIHGEVGTPVTLTISRPPTPPFGLIIVRTDIQVPSVTWRVMEQANNIGYIQIASFTERTGEEVVTALQELLLEKEVFGLILDVRDNAGGLLDPSVTTASQFLREGLVVLTELHRDGQERRFPMQGGSIATEAPLVVLVNGGTASASEIVAGAIQDHGRGLLIGEPTFGKGSVQSIYDLSDGSSLHITSAIWLTPNQHRIEGQGLTPNIYVPRGEGPQDEQLNYAVTYLQSQHFGKESE